MLIADDQETGVEIWCGGVSVRHTVHGANVLDELDGAIISTLEQLGFECCFGCGGWYQSDCMATEIVLPPKGREYGVRVCPDCR